MQKLYNILCFSENLEKLADLCFVIDYKKWLIVYNICVNVLLQLYKYYKRQQMEIAKYQSLLQRSDM